MSLYEGLFTFKHVLVPVRVKPEVILYYTYMYSTCSSTRTFTANMVYLPLWFACTQYVLSGTLRVPVHVPGTCKCIACLAL